MKDVLMRLRVPRNAEMTNRTNLDMSHSISKMPVNTWLERAHDHAQN